MDPLDATVKQNVDTFFSAAAGDRVACAALGLRPGADFAATPSSQSLRALREKTDDELFDKIAETIAADPRITKHLPELALEALSNEGKLTNRDFIPNRLIDIDGHEWTISKAEVSSASHSKSFDPVHQKALQYAVDNFDRFRNLDQTDAPSRRGWNDPDLTVKDMAEGRRRLFDDNHQRIEWARYRNQLRALDTVIAEFDKIDANHSGKISASEGEAWLVKNGKQYDGDLRSYLPVSTTRILRGTELFSLEQLRAEQKRMTVELQTLPPFFSPPDYHTRRLRFSPSED